jgi:hypothetical protein
VTLGERDHVVRARPGVQRQGDSERREADGHFARLVRMLRGHLEGYQQR